MYDGSSLGWYLPISSITLPSRFLRESTTTMRYCGTRTLPRRFKRILTATAVVSPRKFSGGGDRDARVGHRATISDGHCLAADERVRSAQDSTVKSARRAGPIVAETSRGPAGPPVGSAAGTRDRRSARPATAAHVAHPTDVRTLTRRRVTERHPWLYPSAVTRPPGPPARRLADLRHPLGDPRAGHARAAGPRQEARLAAAPRALPGRDGAPAQQGGQPAAGQRPDRRRGDPAGRDVLVQQGGRQLHPPQGVRRRHAALERRRARPGSAAASASWPTCCTGCSCTRRSPWSSGPSTASTRSPTRTACCPGASAARSSGTTSTSWSATTPTSPSSCTPGSTRSTCAASSAPTGRSSTPTRSRRATRSSSGSADRVWRRNEIWRTVVDRRTGDIVGEELVKRNCAVVKYPPPEHLVGRPGRAADPRPRSAQLAAG